ncbi:amino acid/amide ABC transporter substrate-binding protein, HAAT family [Jatrophihabitans endophyticus]|uniref:Amino acid/amide ABC transporter substrate-binding protein, HAAT family n=1 Tax=Jatrophihabitans endophyticus TaxID=1206085 RepID=A0A1M5M079_9ACTN|nr:ABC transporter substrate-binding protein [Jatrophihabitans endophyticus]SHG70754.1 amino acid/amide ABC transporter substrate-binding protein, HAAT family [Jatrophihabitans endophyticus]
MRMAKSNAVLGVAAGCAATLVLAACGSGTTSGGGGGGGGGATGGSDGGSGKTIKIGTLHPLTGTFAGDGAQLENGVKLGIKAVNDAGGIKSLGGAKLALDPGDTKGTPETGQSEAQRLVQDGAVALVGTYQSAVAQNIAAVAERNKTPFLMDVASDNEILQHGYKYSFRVQPKASLFAEQAAKYLQTLNASASPKITKIAYLHESSNFGTGNYKIFKQAVERAGVSVSPEIGYDAASVSDLTTQVTQIKASGAQAVAVSGYYNDGVLAAKAIAAVQPKLQAVLGVADGAFDQAQFVADVGSRAENYFDVNYALGKSAEATKLATDYRSTYGAAMRTEAAIAYDAVKVIAAGLEGAKSTDRTKLRDAIAASKVTPVVSGSTISFDAAGENTGALPVLEQVQKGKVVTVLPAKDATAEPIFPAVPGK